MKALQHAVADLKCWKIESTTRNAASNLKKQKKTIGTAEFSVINKPADEVSAGFRRQHGLKPASQKLLARKAL